jgi:hypothetical protein
VISPLSLIAPQQLTNAAAVYYKTPNGIVTQIRKLTFTNTTGGAITVTIYLVPPAGTAADANTIVKTRSIATLATFEAFEVEGHLLPTGWTIQALASANTSVTVCGSGIELS